MKIAIGCDPNAQKFKEEMITYIKGLGYDCCDFGSENPIYAEVATEVAKAVAQKKYDRGILICGTGIGMCIAANKVKGAYAALVNNVFQAQRAELSNHANIITMGAQVTGIEVAKMDAVDKGFGKKGGYSLEFVKTETPKVTTIKPMLQTKKKSKSWIWILAALLIIILLLALLLMRWKKEPEVITVVQRDTLTVVQKDTVTVVKIDTVYVQQVEEIAKDFNAAQFKVGSYELNDNAKFALHDLANVMIKNPQLQLLIKGHTSDEGNADYNQRLSENRAKAAVDFLVSQGVDRSRLTYEGKGSSEPIDPDNRELNRRTEFIIVNN